MQLLAKLAAQDAKIHVLTVKASELEAELFAQAESIRKLTEQLGRLDEQVLNLDPPRKAGRLLAQRNAQQ